MPQYANKSGSLAEFSDEAAANCTGHPPRCVRVKNDAFDMYGYHNIAVLYDVRTSLQLQHFGRLFAIIIIYAVTIQSSLFGF